MSELIQSITTWMQELGWVADPEGKLVITLGVLIVIWLMQYIIRRFYVDKIEDQRQRYQWGKILGYFSIGLALLALAVIWLPGSGSWATYLGLLSAGLAVALRDPVTDLVGWAFILLRKPFEVGDRIQIGEFAGDVIDQRYFMFSMMEIGNWVAADQSTGRLLHIPNSMVFTAVLANYTKGSEYIWNEMPVLVTFESDWEKAKGILEEISDVHSNESAKNAERSFREAANQYMLRYGTLTSHVYTSVLDSGVNLTIRYLCAPRNRRGSEERIWEDILRRFAEHDDIEFAYPTQRFYTQSQGGKKYNTVTAVVAEGGDSTL